MSKDLRFLKHAVDELPASLDDIFETIGEELDHYSQIDEHKYRLAIVNPFLQTVKGVRIPNMVSDSTIAVSDT